MMEETFTIEYKLVEERSIDGNVRMKIIVVGEKKRKRKKR